MNKKKINISSHRRLSSLIIGTAAVRIAGLFLSFFVGIQLARYLGIEEYGIYSTVMAFLILGKWREILRLKKLKQNLFFGGR